MPDVMNYSYVLLLIAVLPALVLMYLIYKQDKIEPEPPKLLLVLFLGGIGSTVIASTIEGIGSAILGALFLRPGTTFLYNFFFYFIIVAGAEEGGKFFFLKLTSWKHPAFNFRFDGVVYSVFVTLGFAAFENILYVFNRGIGVGGLRAFTAVPLHCICGIFMGHFYGTAKIRERMRREQDKKLFLALSLLVPIFLHGLYDFLLSMGISMLGFFLLLLIFYALAITSVIRFAKRDMAIPEEMPLPYGPQSGQVLVRPGAPASPYASNFYGPGGPMRPGPYPAQPGMQQGMPAPGMGQPVMQQGMPAPGMGQPGMQQGMPAPGMAQPGMQQGMSAPGMGQPAMQQAAPGPYVPEEPVTPSAPEPEALVSGYSNSGGVMQYQMPMYGVPVYNGRPQEAYGAQNPPSYPPAQ